MCCVLALNHSPEVPAVICRCHIRCGAAADQHLSKGVSGPKWPAHLNMSTAHSMWRSRRSAPVEGSERPEVAGPFGHVDAHIPGRPQQVGRCRLHLQAPRLQPAPHRIIARLQAHAAAANAANTERWCSWYGTVLPGDQGPALLTRAHVKIFLGGCSNKRRATARCSSV